MLNGLLPGLNDPDGLGIPGNLPPVVDAHVHLFPDWIFQALWKWFAKHAWPIRYQMKAEEILDFLFARGIRQVVALQYAHRPGMAAELNAFMRDICAKYPNVIGLASIYPGEDGVEDILEQAFGFGLKGVKLHAHVQGFDLNSPEMERIYAVCAAARKPLVLHGGREPKSPAYPVDPYQICGVAKVERILKNFPRLRLCIPHLGLDELPAYRRLLKQYDQLWLDTAMVLSDYFPGHEPPDLLSLRADRIMYGSDFPNLPFAWDRELKIIAEYGLPEDRLAMLLHTNALEFFSID